MLRVVKAQTINETHYRDCDWIIVNENNEKETLFVFDNENQAQEHLKFLELTPEQRLEELRDALRGLDVRLIDRDPYTGGPLWNADRELDATLRRCFMHINILRKLA